MPINKKGKFKLDPYGEFLKDAYSLQNDDEVNWRVWQRSPYQKKKVKEELWFAVWKQQLQVIEYLQNQYRNKLAKFSSDSSFWEVVQRWMEKKFLVKKKCVSDDYFQEDRKRRTDQGIAISFEDCKKAHRNRKIEDQKESLRKWVCYLWTKQDKPPEVLYWILREVKDLSKFSKDTQSFWKRIHNGEWVKNATTASFPELVPEVVDFVIDFKMSTINNQQDDSYSFPERIDQEQQEILKKKKSFKEIYEIWYTQRFAKQNQLLSNTNGERREYWPEDYEELVKTLEWKNTWRCIANTQTAKDWCSKGKFLIYYSQDTSWAYTIPRYSIRLENGKIAELSWVKWDDQVMDDALAATCIVEEKLQTFNTEESPLYAQYQQRKEWMQVITSIQQKVKENNCDEIGEDELPVLFETENIVWLLGDKDPRVDVLRNNEILNKKYKDFSWD